jgi:hypothetical protein
MFFSFTRSLVNLVPLNFSACLHFTHRPIPLSLSRNAAPQFPDSCPHTGNPANCPDNFSFPAGLSRRHSIMAVCSLASQAVRLLSYFSSPPHAPFQIFFN